MFKILLGFFALAQILTATILLSPDLFMRVSAGVVFDRQATSTWNKTVPTVEINVSPAGAPLPAPVTQTTTIIPPPPNTHSH